jgi:sugar-phosphatase
VCHGQPARATVAAFLAPGDVATGIAVIDRLELELARGVRALPGARDLLASLPSGRWGIVTSGIRVLATTRLQASGIALPDVVVTADDVTDGKPHPEGYALALRRLGADPGRSVVFEDAPTGIAAARAAGVGTVIGVGPRAVEADVDRIVSDLRAVRWDGDALVVVRGPEPG